MYRRTFLMNCLLSGFTTASAGLIAQTPAAYAKTLVKTNGLEIKTVSDGNLRLPIGFMFPDVPQDELNGLLQHNLVDDSFIEPDLNLTLMRQGDRIILFDAGSGPNFMPSAGRLTETLDNAGIAPEEITDVIFTHGHPDHLWGILDDFDDVLFSEAQLHFPRKEFEFWMDEDTVRNMPEARQSFAVGAKNRLGAIADRTTFIEDGMEVLPGIEAVGSNGHTPGHMSYVIHGLDDPVMVIGDALTNHVISFQKPDWPSGSDHDTNRGIETRRLLLDRLTHEKMQLIGYHLPNGGVGIVEKDGLAYRFVSV